MIAEEILKIKKLNAAYIAAIEYDRCPDSRETDNVLELYNVGITKEELQEALDENEGRRPDEIAREMSGLIKELK